MNDEVTMLSCRAIYARAMARIGGGGGDEVNAGWGGAGKLAGDAADKPAGKSAGKSFVKSSSKSTRKSLRKSSSKASSSRKSARKVSRKKKLVGRNAGVAAAKKVKRSTRAGRKKVKAVGRG